MAKKAFKATFKREAQDLIKKSIKTTFSENEIGLYIHFPFCRSLCPACPYVRMLWNEKIVDGYVKALKHEIEIYGNLLSDLNLKVTDIHVGGGTPSLLNAGIYTELLDKISQYFEIDEMHRLGIEVNPEDLVEEKAFRLREAGVKELSIGVQSFFTKNLRMLGRRHSVEDSLEAIENARNAGFDLVNIDMMYMLPKQTIHGWIQDLRLAIEQDATQITLYPLLIVHYRPMYERMKKGNIPQQPSKRKFKAMYYTAVDALKKSGYKPVRYYSFSKISGEYSTVEREMVGSLIGLGSGAMGFTGGSEYINTCFVREYIRSLMKSRLPIAGIRSVSKEERAIRWTAERLSALQLSFDDFRNAFKEEINELIGRTGFRYSLRIYKLLRHIKQYKDRIEMTRKGMFARNLTGWAFVLLVPCNIVEKCLETPWPLEITIP